MTFSPETQAALIADGEKLAALTGEDHGPWDLADYSDEQDPARRISAAIALSENCTRSSDRASLYDKTGRAIEVGDVLKVYHFTAALRRKKHYIYRQVAIADRFRDGTPIFRVSYLDLTDDFYTLICDGSHLPDYEIVQSIDCTHADRPRHTTTL